MRHSVRLAIAFSACAALAYILVAGGGAVPSVFAASASATAKPTPAPSAEPSPDPSAKPKKPIFLEDQSFGSPEDDEERLKEEQAKVESTRKEAEKEMEKATVAPPESQMLNPEESPQSATAQKLLDVPKDVITELILDASGSMKAKIQQRTKLYQAKRVLRAFMMEAHNDNMVLGLRVYGLKPKNCKDTHLVLGFGEKGADAVDSAMQQVDPKGYGKTPLARSLEDAEKDLKKYPGKPRRIIVVTDGMDTCKGDPCKVAKRLAEEFDIRIYVVGYALEGEDKEKLKCLTDFGGAAFDADDFNSLMNAMNALGNHHDKNLFVKSPDPAGLSELWEIDPKAKIPSKRRKLVGQFVSSLGTHAEPGVEYEVTVKLRPPFLFEHVILQPAEKRTLEVKGNGAVNITFMKQLFTIEMMNEAGKVLATFASDTPTAVPTGHYKVHAVAAPFADTSIDDIIVVPNGTYTESIKGFGALQVNTPDRGFGPFGMYVFDDQKKQDIGSYLTSIPLVLPVGRYTLKSVGNSILRNIYPEASKVFEVPLPPPGQTVTFSRRESKAAIAKEDKESEGKKGPVMLDSLTPEQIKKHLEEQEKNGMETSQ